jgi:ferredoxin-NADP reductase
VFSGQEAERVVLIAGGIGITPMMAIIRSLTDRGWGGEVYLLYSVKSVQDLVFRDELTFLQARFPNLQVRVTVTRDPDTPWQGLRGHITRGMIADFVPELTRGPILLCGPIPMMAGAREILVNMGVRDTEILEEAFVSPTTVEPSAGAAPIAMGEQLLVGRTANIVFTRAGKTTEFPPERTVLEVAEDAGVEIPFECRAGICGQCKTLLISGQVTMDVQDALTASDRSKGLILACQARATRDVEVYA